MVLGEQDTVRRLAEAKAYLERRLSDLEKEVLSLRSLTEVIDQVLAEKSFKRVGPPVVEKASTEEATPARPPLKTPLTTVKGVHLADFIVQGKNITVVPAEGVELALDTPPLNSFLVAKVLEPMKSRDQELVRSGKLAEAESFSYEIVHKDGFIREIRISNFGDEKRLMELNSAVKWTLRRIYERSAKE